MKNSANVQLFTTGIGIMIMQPKIVTRFERLSEVLSMHGLLAIGLSDTDNFVLRNHYGENFAREFRNSGVTVFFSTDINRSFYITRNTRLEYFDEIELQPIKSPNSIRRLIAVLNGLVTGLDHDLVIYEGGPITVHTEKGVVIKIIADANFSRREVH